MVKWVARLAILAAFLGVVGTVAIVSYLHRHRNKEKQQDAVKKEQQSNEIPDTQKVKEQPQLPTANQAATVPEAEVVIRKEDTIRKALPEEQEKTEKPLKPPVTKIDEKNQRKRLR